MKEPLINFVCFMIAGWINNFGYCVMLSAAKHIIGTSTPTSVVLICDILPGFLLRLVLPFFIEKMSYLLRVIITVITAILGFFLASLSPISFAIGLIGVVCHSLSSSLGETTFLGYSSQFSTSCITGWSSGTGLAGITAAGFYAILSDVLHVDTTIILYTFLPLPLLILEAFWISNPAISPGQQRESEAKPLTEVTTTGSLTFKQKLSSLFQIWPFLFSLFLVYVSEYIINQSVNSVIDFPGSAQEGIFYTFSQFAYQLGVFLSRSSLPWFKVPKQLITIPSFVQFGFLVLFAFEAVYLFIPDFWVMMVLVFCEGLMGGLVYVNGMYLISVNSRQGPEREFRMSIASLFNSTGILVASLMGLWVEPLLKDSRIW